MLLCIHVFVWVVSLWHCCKRWLRHLISYKKKKKKKFDHPCHVYVINLVLVPYTAFKCWHCICECLGWGIHQRTLMGDRESKSKKNKKTGSLSRCYRPFWKEMFDFLWNCLCKAHCHVFKHSVVRAPLGLGPRLMVAFFVYVSVYLFVWVDEDWGQRRESLRETSKEWGKLKKRAKWWWRTGGQNVQTLSTWGAVCSPFNFNFLRIQKWYFL